MGVQVDKARAKAVFENALQIARSSAPLPADWLEMARRVGEAKSITFTPALGTALLAKATNRMVDALSLTASTHKGYSARSLAKDVLVPCTMQHGINIRTTGAEPLNNQPFLRAERIGPELDVKANAKNDLLYLVECVKTADFLENDTALAALAAFLRVRIETTALQGPVPLGPGVLELPALSKVLDEFLAGDSEGGKTGQAAVSAVLDLVFERVRTKRINDPSAKWPGDVGVFHADKLTLSVEVKQRPFTETEILQFVDRLSKEGVHRAVIAALRQERRDLNVEQLCANAYSRSRVVLSVCSSASELLLQGVRFSPSDLPVSLSSFPVKFLARLTELEVTTSRRMDWARHFEALPS